MLTAKTSGYGTIAKLLHWLIFLLLVAQYVIGSVMPHITRHSVVQSWIAWHFSVGAAILLFITLRMIWRMLNSVPPLETLTRWERVGAGITHWALYVLVLTMSVLGWAATNALGWDVRLFGILTLPAIANRASQWGYLAGGIHNKMVYVLLFFIILHIIGVLYHYYVKRDGVLRRMVPLRRFASDQLKPVQIE